MSEGEFEEPIEGANESVETVLAEAVSVFGDAREGPKSAERNRAVLRRYLHEIRGIKLLTAEQERELALRVQAGDAEAERRLVEASLRLVVTLARRYVNLGLSLPDLIEEGNLGLLHAVRRFRPHRDTRFSTYASWWIRQALVRALANQARLIRLQGHVERLLFHYTKAHTALTQTLGRTPTVAEVAERLARPVELVEDLEALRRERPVSLEAPAGSEGQRRLRGLLDRSPALSASGLATALPAPRDLAAVLRELPDVERTVVTHRFGLDGEAPMTLESIGRQLGVTRERVRQLEGAALRRLAGALEARGVDLSDRS